MGAQQVFHSILFTASQKKYDFTIILCAYKTCYIIKNVIELLTEISENGLESAYFLAAWQHAWRRGTCQINKYVTRPANIHSFKTTFFHTEFILMLSSFSL